ncbi:hypothetical protein [Haloplanus natans]|uniref:hypothetical protein n=1 Tax=Haloplanus natans TaxID=376171 RepID=UPI000677F27D|nr:hypothetical protein [Haloplanus natans]
MSEDVVDFRFEYIVTGLAALVIIAAGSYLVYSLFDLLSEFLPGGMVIAVAVITVLLVFSNMIGAVLWTVSGLENSEGGEDA